MSVSTTCTTLIVYTPPVTPIKFLESIVEKEKLKLLDLVKNAAESAKIKREEMQARKQNGESIEMSDVFILEKIIPDPKMRIIFLSLFLNRVLGPNFDSNENSSLEKTKLPKNWKYEVESNQIELL